MDVLRLATFTGAQPNVSDAYTINGQPGDLYRCSSKGFNVLGSIQRFTICIWPFER